MMKLKRLLEPREWLTSGGGGHEDGEDGLRAGTWSGEALVEMLEVYADDLSPLITAHVQEAVAATTEEFAQHIFIGMQYAGRPEDDLFICNCGLEYNGEGPISAETQWAEHIRSLSPSHAAILEQIKQAAVIDAFVLLGGGEVRDEPTHARYKQAIARIEARGALTLLDKVRDFLFGYAGGFSRDINSARAIKEATSAMDDEYRTALQREAEDKK